MKQRSDRAETISRDKADIGLRLCHIVFPGEAESGFSCAFRERSALKGRSLATEVVARGFEKGS